MISVFKILSDAQLLYCLCVWFFFFIYLYSETKLTVNHNNSAVSIEMTGKYISFSLEWLIMCRWRMGKYLLPCNNRGYCLKSARTVCAWKAWITMFQQSPTFSVILSHRDSEWVSWKEETPIRIQNSPIWGLRA